MENASTLANDDENTESRKIASISDHVKQIDTAEEETQSACQPNNSENGEGSKFPTLSNVPDVNKQNKTPEKLDNSVKFDSEDLDSEYSNVLGGNKIMEQLMRIIDYESSDESDTTQDTIDPTNNEATLEVVTKESLSIDGNDFDGLHAETIENKSGDAENNDTNCLEVGERDNKMNMLMNGRSFDDTFLKPVVEYTSTDNAEGNKCFRNPGPIMKNQAVASTLVDERIPKLKTQCTQTEVLEVSMVINTSATTIVKHGSSFDNNIIDDYRGTDDLDSPFVKISENQLNTDLNKIGESSLFISKEKQLIRPRNENRDFCTKEFIGINASPIINNDATNASITGNKDVEILGKNSIFSRNSDVNSNNVMAVQTQSNKVTTVPSKNTSYEAATSSSKMRIDKTQSKAVGVVSAIPNSCTSKEVSANDLGKSNENTQNNSDVIILCLEAMQVKTVDDLPSNKVIMLDLGKNGQSRLNIPSSKEINNNQTQDTATTTAATTTKKSLPVIKNVAGNRVTKEPTSNKSPTSIIYTFHTNDTVGNKRADIHTNRRCTEFSKTIEATPSINNRVGDKKCKSKPIATKRDSLTKSSSNSNANNSSGKIKAKNTRHLLQDSTSLSLSDKRTVPAPTTLDAVSCSRKQEKLGERNNKNKTYLSSVRSLLKPNNQPPIRDQIKTNKQTYTTSLSQNQKHDDINNLKTSSIVPKSKKRKSELEEGFRSCAIQKRDNGKETVKETSVLKDGNTSSNSQAPFTKILSRNKCFPSQLTVSLTRKGSSSQMQEDDCCSEKSSSSFESSGLNYDSVPEEEDSCSIFEMWSSSDESSEEKREMFRTVGKRKRTNDQDLKVSSEDQTNESSDNKFKCSQPQGNCQQQPSIKQSANLGPSNVTSSTLKRKVSYKRKRSGDNCPGSLASNKRLRVQSNSDENEQSRLIESTKKRNCKARATQRRNTKVQSTEEEEDDSQYSEIKDSEEFSEWVPYSDEETEFSDDTSVVLDSEDESFVSQSTSDDEETSSDDIFVRSDLPELRSKSNVLSENLRPLQFRKGKTFLSKRKVGDLKRIWGLDAVVKLVKL